MHCDLHTHSNHSDGTLSPARLIAAAKEQNLIIALTDHNTVSGLPEFMAEAERLGVTAVPGIELSTEYLGRELHLLGLFIMPEHYRTVEQTARSYHVLKEISNIALIERLNEAGYRIEYAAVKRRNVSGNANRAHVAAELMEQGYVSSVHEAFSTLLGTEHGFYVPPERFHLMDAIGFLRGIRAIPILAHPLQELTGEELRTLLPEAMEAGLLGLECIHSSYDGEKLALASSIAAEFGLLPSGGSDFHGDPKPDVFLGTGRKDNVSVPASLYEDLKKLHEST